MEYKLSFYLSMGIFKILKSVLSKPYLLFSSPISSILVKSSFLISNISDLSVLFSILFSISTNVSYLSNLLSD